MHAGAAYRPQPNHFGDPGFLLGRAQAHVACMARLAAATRQWQQCNHQADTHEPREQDGEDAWALAGCESAQVIFTCSLYGQAYCCCNAALA